MNLYTNYFESPLGYVQVKADDSAIVSVIFTDEPAAVQENALVNRCIGQLQQYFNGGSDKFDIPIRPAGTAFQQEVWRQIANIPFGNKMTYSEIAAAIGKTNANRAVGSAVGKNPLALLIPCHRVVPKSDMITGFAWGPWRKEWLLEHEKRTVTGHIISPI